MAASLILTTGCTIFGKWREETFPNRHSLLLIRFSVVFIVFLRLTLWSLFNSTSYCGSELYDIGFLTFLTTSPSIFVL
jgi:hypothetical protein